MYTLANNVSLVTNEARIANLAHNLDELRINDTSLKNKTWEDYDQKVVDIVEKHNTGIKDIRNNGLIYNLPSTSKILSYFEVSGDMEDAQIDLYGESQPRLDTVTYNQIGVPIPLIHSRYAMHFREGNDGEEQDRLRKATLSVQYAIEKMLFQGANIVVQGNRVYGYTNLPQRKTLTLTGGNDKWLSAGANIIQDVNAMLQLLNDANYIENIHMYVSTDIYMQLHQDYSTAKGDLTNMERIMAMGVKSVKQTAYLPSKNVVCVSLTADTVDLAVARDVQVAKWSDSKMTEEFRIYAIQAPRLKYDKNNQCGIVHGS